MICKKSVLAASALFLSLGPVATSQADDVAAFEAMFPTDEAQEEDVYRTDRLLLTATGSLKPVHLAPSVATVVTAEDIEKAGATTLDEVLEMVPGLHVEPSGTAYMSSTWSIRGSHTVLNPHALLLVNSVPITSNYQGGRQLTFKMPVAMISRVEVVRGPGSALHGADAFSGTINVITKDNHEIDGSRMGARAGSFDTYDTWLQHGGEYAGFELALGIEWQKSKGDENRIIDNDFVHHPAPGFPPANPSASMAPGPLDSAYELLDTHLHLRKSDWSLHLYGGLQDSNAGLGSLQTVTTESDIDNKFLLADISYRKEGWLPDLDVNGRLYYSYQEIDNHLQQLPASYLNMIGNPIMESQDGGIEASAVYKGFSNHQLRLGVGWKNYEADPDQYKNFGPAAGANQFGPLVHVTDPGHIYIDDANRQLWYVLAQDEWQLLRNLALTAGVRYDDYSDFGDTTNPRAALVWEARYDLTAKLMYGQAFRAPSFSEQWVKNNPQTIGNPDLGPEETEIIELAFDYQPMRDLRVILSLFSYESTDLIELVATKYTNVGEQKGKGGELELDWQVHPSVRLRANGAYQRSKLSRTDAVVPEAPELQFYLNPHWAFMDNWSLDGQYYWIGGRHRAQGDSRDDIADYDLVNLTLRREHIAKHWESALAVRNLFDKGGRIPSPYHPAASEGAFIPGDYPIAGRAIWLEVKCHF